MQLAGSALVLRRQRAAPSNEQLRYMPPVHSFFNPLKAGPWLRMTRLGHGQKSARPFLALTAKPFELLLHAVPVDHLLCEVILDLGRVPQNLIVSGFQQLFAAVVELRTKCLLHPGDDEFAPS